MLGPAEDAFGGISSVISMYRVGGLFDTDRVRFIATFKSGTKIKKFFVACSALLEYLGILLNGGGQLLHVHVASDASFWRKFFFIWLARAFNRTILFHLHSGDFARFFAQRCPSFLQFLLLRTLANVDHILCLSSPMAAWLKQHVSEIPILIFPNPILIARGADVRWKVRPPKILFLGVISRNKGAVDLVHAFAKVAKDHPYIKLIVAGRGDIEELRATAYQLGCLDLIETPGWVDGEKKGELLSQARILVLPSHFEGQPMVLLEAMAAGALIVASQVGGIPDIVQHQRTALLIKPGDRCALASALVAGLTLSAENEAMVINAYQYVHLNHEASEVVVRLLEFYSSFQYSTENSKPGDLE